MNDINRSTVLVNLSAVTREPITDTVGLDFRNQRAASLNRRVLPENRAWGNVTLENLPAVPFGLTDRKSVV